MTTERLSMSHCPYQNPSAPHKVLMGNKLFESLATFSYLNLTVGNEGRNQK